MKRNNSGQIRIIAGKWRGRKLPVADSPGLRPTTDRTKETLFNWLMPHLHPEMRCLDLFTGSGGLGLEALSRGVAHVTMVEKESAIVKNLKSIQRTLGSQEQELAIVQQDALRFLAASAAQQPYDLVFLDPPFDAGLLQPCIALLLENRWLAEEALIYIEHESPLELSIPTSLSEIKSKKTKQVSYRLLSLD